MSLHRTLQPIGLIYNTTLCTILDIQNRNKLIKGVG